MSSIELYLLIEAWVAALQVHLQTPASLEPAIALPGFHIFPAPAIPRTDGMSPHLDLQSKRLNWGGCTIDTASPISFTLPVRLPAVGGGLNVWDLALDDLRAAQQRDPATTMHTLLPRKTKRFIHYTLEQMALHSGYALHQIAGLPHVEGATSGSRCRGTACWWRATGSSIGDTRLVTRTRRHSKNPRDRCREAADGAGKRRQRIILRPATGAWEINHHGQGNFILQLCCASGDSLVQNQIGGVSGSRVVSFGHGPCFWEVRADGAWSLQPHLRRSSRRPLPISYREPRPPAQAP